MDSNSERFGVPWSLQNSDGVRTTINPNEEYQQFNALTFQRNLESNSLTHDIKNIQNIHTDDLMKPPVPNHSSAVDFTLMYRDHGMGTQTESKTKNRVGTDLISATGSTIAHPSTKPSDPVSNSLVCAISNPNSLMTSTLKTAENQLVSVQERLPSINESFLRKSDNEMKSTPTSVLQASNIQDHAGLWGRNMFQIENFVRNLSDAVSKNAQRIKQESTHSWDEYTKRDSESASSQNASVPSTSLVASDITEETIATPLVSPAVKVEECCEDKKDSEDPAVIISKCSEQEEKEESGPSGENLDEEKSLMKADYTKIVPVGPVQCAVDKSPDSAKNNSSKAKPLGKKNIHLELRVKCNFCKNTFKNEARLRTHVNKFHSALIGDTSENIKDQDEVKEDNDSLNMDSNKTTDDNEEYICPVCDKKLDSKSILLLHINSRHVLDRLRICLECAKMFESQEALEEHIKQEHADSNLYSMIFNKRPKLMPSDIAKKREKKTHKSPSKESNETGFQKITGPNPGDLVYQCVKCSSTFAGEDAIQEHFKNDKDCMLKKAVEHKHTCPICKKTLKTNIAEHMRTHSDERPYECTICFSRFKRGHQLKMHVQSLHSDEAKFQCEICGRRFKRKDKLSCHYRSHTDDHPYMCTECGNVFKWKHHVKRHMMTVHQNIKRKESMKRHPCHICGKSFTWGHHVKRHLRNVHQVDTSNMGKFSNQEYRHRMIADINAAFPKTTDDRDGSIEEEGMDVDSEGNDSKNYGAYAEKGDESDDYDEDESIDDNKDYAAPDSRTSLEESNEKLRQLAEAVCREAESLLLQNSMTKDKIRKEDQPVGTEDTTESCPQNPEGTISKEPEKTERNEHKEEHSLQNPVVTEITSKEPQITAEKSSLQSPVTIDISSKVAQPSEGYIHMTESCRQNPVTIDTSSQVHVRQPTGGNTDMANTGQQNPIVTYDDKDS